LGKATKRKGVRVPSVLYEKRDGIGWIRFNRPEVRNAISSAEIATLIELLGVASEDNDVDAIVVGGVGDAFSAGADLKEMVREFEEMASRRLTITELIETTTEGLQQVARLMRRAKKLVLASVQGYALGGGCEIALDCDLIVASHDAKFGFPETRAGMSITGGVSKLLAQSIGAARARELILTGRFIDAAEALDIGMINRVAPTGQNDQAAIDLIREVRRGSPLSVVAHKRLLQQSLDADLETALNLEKQSIGVLCTSEDATEAVSAFVEKREPSFKGR
jgi:enoyl-CoA hydratase/carnithine racemase